MESSLQNRINELTPRKEASEQASKDLEFYADHLEYLALRDQCFEVNDGKFAYSLCMLGRVTQRELEGDRNSVTLGEVGRLLMKTFFVLCNYYTFFGLFLKLLWVRTYVVFYVFVSSIV